MGGRCAVGELVDGDGGGGRPALKGQEGMKRQAKGGSGHEQVQPESEERMGERAFHKQRQRYEIQGGALSEVRRDNIGRRDCLRDSQADCREKTRYSTSSTVGFTHWMCTFEFPRNQRGNLLLCPTTPTIPPITAR